MRDRYSSAVICRSSATVASSTSSKSAAASALARSCRFEPRPDLGDVAAPFLGSLPDRGGVPRRPVRSLRDDLLPGLAQAGPRTRVRAAAHVREQGEHACRSGALSLPSTTRPRGRPSGRPRTRRRRRTRPPADRRLRTARPGSARPSPRCDGGRSRPFALQDRSPPREARARPARRSTCRSRSRPRRPATLDEARRPHKQCRRVTRDSPDGRDRIPRRRARI